MFGSQIDNIIIVWKGCALQITYTHRTVNLESSLIMIFCINLIIQLLHQRAL